MRNRLATKIKKAMRLKAPIYLKELMAKHPEKNEAGAVIPDAHDGIAMFKAIKTTTGTEVRVAGSLASSPLRTHSRVEASPEMTMSSLGVWMPSLGLGLGLP